jgi:hypothetical protein
MRQSRRLGCPRSKSRMNREVHVRFWERLEVKFLRATRPERPFAATQRYVRSWSTSRHCKDIVNASSLTLSRSRCFPAGRAKQSKTNPRPVWTFALNSNAETG